MRSLLPNKLITWVPTTKFHPTGTALYGMTFYIINQAANSIFSRKNSSSLIKTIPLIQAAGAFFITNQTIKASGGEKLEWGDAMVLGTVAVVVCSILNRQKKTGQRQLQASEETEEDELFRKFPLAVRVADLEPLKDQLNKLLKKKESHYESITQKLKKVQKGKGLETSEEMEKINLTKVNRDSKLISDKKGKLLKILRFIAKRDSLGEKMHDTTDYKLFLRANSVVSQCQRIIEIAELVKRRDEIERYSEFFDLRTLDEGELKEDRNRTTKSLEANFEEGKRSRDPSPILDKGNHYQKIFDKLEEIQKGDLSEASAEIEKINLQELKLDYNFFESLVKKYGSGGVKIVMPETTIIINKCKAIIKIAELVKRRDEIKRYSKIFDLKTLG